MRACMFYEKGFAGLAAMMVISDLIPKGPKVSPPAGGLIPMEAAQAH